MERTGVAGVEIEAELVSRFEQSLARCVQDERFIDAFYERFLAASPDVRVKFQKTDFNKQKKILETSLYMMARAALGLEDGATHLESIATSHSRRGLDIAPSLYTVWLSCLIDTARSTDPQFSTEVEASWRELLQRGIDRMVDVYRASQTVPPVGPSPSPRS